MNSLCCHVPVTHGSLHTAAVGHLTDMSFWKTHCGEYITEISVFSLSSLHDLPILWCGFPVSTVSRWLLTSCLLTNMSWSRPRSPNTSWRGNLLTCAGRWDTFSHNYLIWSVFSMPSFTAPRVLSAVWIEASFTLVDIIVLKERKETVGVYFFHIYWNVKKHYTNYMSIQFNGLHIYSDGYKSPVFSNWTSRSWNEMLLYSFFFF